MGPPSSPRPDDEHDGPRHPDGDTPPDGAPGPPETAAPYGQTCRAVYLMRARHLLDVTWQEFAAKQIPKPVQPQTEDFSELTLLVVPRKDKGAIAWDIAIRDFSSTPQWTVWRMKTGQLSEQDVQASVTVNGGITIGRVTSKDGRTKVLQNLPALAVDEEYWQEDTQSQLWAFLVIEQLHHKLDKLLEFSRGNDSDELECLPRYQIMLDRLPSQEKEANVTDLVVNEGFILVDQHLLDDRLKWSSKAYPPCTLKLGSRSLGLDEEYVVFSGSKDSDRTKPNEWHQLPQASLRLHNADDDEYRGAVVLLPGRFKLPDSPGNEVGWAVAVVDRVSGSCTVVFVSKRGTERETDFSWRDIHFAHIRRHWSGGILVGYCKNPYLGVPEDYQQPGRDTLLWATKILTKAANAKLLRAPDKESRLLEAEWIDMLYKYLKASLGKEVTMDREKVKVTGSVLSQVAEGEWELVDERFMQLTREVLHPYARFRFQHQIHNEPETRHARPVQHTQRSHPTAQDPRPVQRKRNAQHALPTSSSSGHHYAPRYPDPPQPPWARWEADGEHARRIAALPAEFKGFVHPAHELSQARPR